MDHASLAVVARDVLREPLVRTECVLKKNESLNSVCWIPPPPRRPRLFQLNRERRDARLAVAVVGQRVAQSVLSEGGADDRGEVRATQPVDQSFSIWTPCG